MATCTVALLASLLGKLFPESYVDASIFWVKLLATPLLLMGLTWHGERKGARSAGVWAAFPVVTGPILAILAYQHGAGLVVALIDFTLPAVLANLGFGLAFAWAASTRDRGWWPAMQCLALGLLSYAAISALIVALAPPLLVSALLVAISLCLAPRFYPKIKAFADVPAVKPSQMYWQKACIGSTVVVLVTYGAELLGHRWGGVLAMFPAMASVMATYYHGREGVASIHFLRGMPKGYWSFSVFCLSLQALLSAFEPYGGPGLCLAFSAAIALSLGLQWLLLGRKTGHVSRH